jgi:hypothetical protein
MWSKLQPLLSGAIGELFHSAVVLIPSTIERYLVYAGLLSPLCHQFADLAGDSGLGRPLHLASQGWVQGAGSGEGMALGVVDHLSVRMSRTTKDAQPRTLAGAHYLAP